jgi:hypothetical protein
MRKILDWYMDMYYKYPLFFKKWDVVNAMIYTVVLLGLIQHKEWTFLSLFIWGWGLSIASLFLKR